MFSSLAKRLGTIAGVEIRRPVRADLSFDARWWNECLNASKAGSGQPARSTLDDFFDANTEGPGIWKWRHYFEIYHKHFARFIGTECKVVEIGVYSGGSLRMWKHYFGPKASIYGVDVEPTCKAYEEQQVEIWIGDQADEKFWNNFISSVGPIDAVIDDGGHETHQQIATLKALLPALRPGGVYLCEDIVGETNRFADYICELSKWLNQFDCRHDYHDTERRLSAEPNAMQRAIHSIHLYPLVAVIERRDAPLDLVAPKHGTVWEPHLT